MKKYRVPKKRVPVKAPAQLVTNGQADFGTYEGPIPDINLLDSKKPCGFLMPDFMIPSRLTVWEAFEISLDEGLLVSAAYNMGGSIGFSIFVWYDKNTKKVSHWMNPVPGAFAHVAPNLIDSKTVLKTPLSVFEINNEFQNHKCKAYGKSVNLKGKIEFDMEIEGISPPSVVNIPFAKNKSLYSQKEFFTAKGTLNVNGKKYKTNEHSTVIIDDHKGFYPFHAHYDWLTSMGYTKNNGKVKYLGFNLTRNQSTDQEKFNENLLWVDDKAFALPPVTFKHKGKHTWIVKDKYGNVDITFKISKIFTMGIPVLLDYSLPFGTLTGYIKADGKKYNFDGMYGIGEDKTTNV